MRLPWVVARTNIEGLRLDSGGHRPEGTYVRHFATSLALGVTCILRPNMAELGWR